MNICYSARQITIAIVLFLCSLFFMLFVSCWTSFITPYFLWDSSIFCCIGQGWHEGLLPYRDIFDHKGCYLFAFYLLAACFGHIKVGLTILMTLLLTLDSLLVYKIARLFLSGKRVWGIILLFYILLACMIGNGGCVEEISLPFILWPVYRLLQLFLKQNVLKDVHSRDFLLMGICCGIHAMLRVNNGGCVVGGVCFLILYLFYHKKYSLAIRNVIICCIGFSAALLPGILYFAQQGALYDLWYGTILFNCFYISTGASEHAWSAQLLMHTHLLILAGAIIADQKVRLLSPEAKGLVLFIALIGTSAISIGTGYAHYSICILPVYVIASSYALCLISRCQKKVHIVVAFALLAAFALAPFTSHLRRQILSSVSTLLLHYRIPCGSISHSSTYQFIERYCLHTREDLMQWAARIPDAEKKSFLAYDCFGDVYLYMNLLPEYRYCFLQGAWSRHKGNGVHAALEKHFQETPPLWLIVGRASLNSPIYDKIISPRYQLITENDTHCLLRLTE